MFPFSSLIRYCRLYCHRRGHGVHSPFAFRVIRDVIVGNGYYYSSGRLMRLTDGFPVALKREYGIVFRLIARLSPKGVRIGNSIEPQMELLVRLADMRPFMATGMGGYAYERRVLTICSASDLRPGVPEKLLADGNILIVRGLKDFPEIKDVLVSEMKGGWVFADANLALFVSNDSERLNEVDVKMI